MSGFIKTHKNKNEDSTLVNDIYSEMCKSLEFAKHADQSFYVEAIATALEKAREKLSDEYDPNEIEQDGSHDPETQGDEYEEYGDDEDEDSHQKNIQEDFGDEEVPEAQTSPDSKASEQAPIDSKASEQAQAPKVKQSRFRQPTRDELNEVRKYTLPWETRAREHAALSAEPAKNPVLAQQGDIIEARNKHHVDKTKAYQDLKDSPEFKAGNPIARMKMDRKFKEDWHAKNPDHMVNALAAHHEAHEKGKDHVKAHAAEKDAAIRNIIGGGGGDGGESFSLEEGMQHAGGIKGESGTQATIQQDPATAFAMGNQDFIRQFAKRYADKNKNKSSETASDAGQYKDKPKRDIESILGPAAAGDPKFQQFFSHYYPLIGMNKKAALRGLDPNHPAADMLDVAGMHGLYQAMNDYDHDHPSKASFATHAGKKILGLQMTAMRHADAIPTDVRQDLKEFTLQNNAPEAAKATKAASAVPVPAKAAEPKSHSVISSSGHPAAADIADRLKRVGAARATAAIKRPAGVKPIKAAVSKQLADPVGFDPMLDEEGQD